MADWERCSGFGRSGEYLGCGWRREKAYVVGGSVGSWWLRRVRQVCWLLVAWVVGGCGWLLALGYGRRCDKEKNASEG
ncbi:unnamed protein product [Prunus armeniaca]|uniref:Transmembrane protein n=1 Tax=Prunus armeniaca TaxID=36596 RepID=A0A6J5XQZ1_PRUAR|nr:unnamed protein product [Prunus armeniaca]